MDANDSQVFELNEMLHINVYVCIHFYGENPYGIINFSRASVTRGRYGSFIALSASQASAPGPLPFWGHGVDAP